MGEKLRPVFDQFAGADGLLDGRGFAKLCKERSLYSSRFRAQDADIIFSKLSRSRKIDYEQFELALVEVAMKKNATVDSLHDTLAGVDAAVAVSDAGVDVASKLAAEG